MTKRDELIEAMARAIKAADKERPFGLYDYSKYPDPNASPPHVVRDEKTGKGILRTHDAKEASALFDRLTEDYVARAALTALEARLGIDLAAIAEGRAYVAPRGIADGTMQMFLDKEMPGWQGVLDKTHVIVPVKPTDKMLTAGWFASDSVQMIYAAMIAAAKDQHHDQ